MRCCAGLAQQWMLGHCLTLHYGGVAAAAGGFSTCMMSMDCSAAASASAARSDFRYTCSHNSHVYIILQH